MSNYVLQVTCPDRSGIIHALSGGIVAVGGNVLEQEQFSDLGTGLFFARTRFDSDQAELGAVRAGLRSALEEFDAAINLRPEAQRTRVLIMVSQYDHCLVDLLYRWSADELPIDIAGIVSNHETCRPTAERYGIPFDHLPVTRESKPAQEARLLAIVEERAVDLVVLARYMQILSDDACRALSGRAINIHHSFLPGFKGARPYHQAHERGVKLIGATAHFVTADLDEGPIIEQEVKRVSHRQTPEDLAEIGRDVERLALSRAVRLFAEDRVFLDGKRTVVFG